MVNSVLRFYDGGYELTKSGEIHKLSPFGFETLIGEAIKTNEPEKIDSRVNSAILKYSHYGSSIEERKEAILKLAGVLEYLKERIKNNGEYFADKDDDALFNIINNFDIRHHKQMQQDQYNKDAWYDWMFYTFLASIYTLLKLNDKQFDLKI